MNDEIRKGTLGYFVKGHLFEVHFKSQALLDEAAALTCRAYVGLNPTQTGMTQPWKTVITHPSKSALIHSLKP